MARKSSVDRRKFLTSAAAGAALAAAGKPAEAQQSAPPRSPIEPSAAVREAESGTPRATEILTTDSPGADFMVDVLKSIGFEYICANPGSSFRGLQESIVNYGGNQRAGVHHVLP